MLYSIGLLFWHWSCLPQCIRGWHESLFYRGKTECPLPRMPEVCSDKIETPSAKKEWVNYFMLNIYLKILVQHTMNTCVTNNASHLLKGLNTCSSLIHPIISNSLQTIKVGIWKEQRYGQSTFSHLQAYDIFLWSH